MVRRGIGKAFLPLLTVLVVALSTSNLFASSYSYLFLPYGKYPIPGYPGAGATAIADVNGDGKNDIVVSAFDDRRVLSRLAVSLQAGSGEISPWLLYPISDNAYLCSLSVGDLNNDGRTDVIVGEQQYSDENGWMDTYLGVFLQNGSGTFDAIRRYPWTRANTCYPQVADMNNDGLSDVVAMATQGDSISIRYQDGGGILSTEVIYGIPPDKYFYFVPGDINNDGLMDIVAVTPKQIKIFFRNQDGTFQQPESREPPHEPSIVGLALGDVNADGLTDIVALLGGYEPASRIAILYQTPSGTLGPWAVKHCAGNPRVVKIADINADGRNDVVVFHDNVDAVSVFFQGPDGTMLPEELSPFVSSQYVGPDALAIDDINSDGLPDLVFGDIAALNSGGSRNITVNLKGSGTGGVFDSMGLISCGYTCESGVWKGLPISFYAKPNEGTRFTGWAGACSGTGACSLTTDEDITLTAFFEREALLKVSREWGEWDAGVVRSSPPGIECGGQGLFCRQAFDVGTAVTLTPHATPGATFLGWSETWVCPGVGECTILMNGDKEISPIFTSCAYSVFPSYVSFPVTGGTTTAYVASTSSGYNTYSCPRSYPVGDCAWLKFLLTYMGSTDTVTILDAEDNRSGLPRTCTAFAAGQTMVVTQDGIPCSVSTVSPSSQTFSSAAASGSFLVKATRSDCPWTVSTESPWIHIASSQGVGAASVAFSVDENPAKAARTGTISIRSLSKPTVEKKFTVRQKPGTKTGVAEAAAHEDVGNSVHGPLYEDLLRPYMSLDPGFDVLAVAVGDVNNDGRNDIVVMTHETLFVYLQDAQGHLQEPAQYPAGPMIGALSIDIADVNGDGRNDVVAAAWDLRVYLQNTAGTLDPFIVYPSPAPMNNCFPQVVKAGDFNNDGRMDVAGAGAYGQFWAAAIWYQNSSGTLDPPTLFYVPYSGTGEIDAADVTGDGRTDLLVMSGKAPGLANVYVLSQNAGGMLDNPLGYYLYDQKVSRGMAVGDVNGDGFKDVVQTTDDGFIAVFLQGQDGRLEEPLLYPSLDRGIPHGVMMELASVAAGDLNGDRRDDIAFLYDGARGYLGIFLQGTNGGLSNEQRYRVPSHYYGQMPKTLVMADINGDGFNDLVAAGYKSEVTVLHNVGNTRLVTVTKGGEGEGSVFGDPAGIDCGSACTKGYAIGTTVTLTASPTADSVFAGWSGACSGIGACVLTIAKDTEVTATFAKSCIYTVSPSLLTPAYGGETREVKIQATGGASCPAPTISEPYDWVEGSLSEWKDNTGTAKIVIAENDSSLLRTASVSVGGTWLAIRQSGVPCRIESLYGGPAKVGPEGGKRGLQVMTTTKDCPWTLTASHPWIHLESSYGHRDGASVAYSVDPNTSGKARRGSITATSLSSPQTKKNLDIQQK